MNEIILQSPKKLNKKYEAISGIIKGIALTRSVSSTRSGAPHEYFIKEFIIIFIGK